MRLAPAAIAGGKAVPRTPPASGAARRTRLSRGSGVAASRRRGARAELPPLRKRRATGEPRTGSAGGSRDRVSAAAKPGAGVCSRAHGQGRGAGVPTSAPRSGRTPADTPAALRSPGRSNSSAWPGRCSGCPGTSGSPLISWSNTVHGSPAWPAVREARPPVQPGPPAQPGTTAPAVPPVLPVLPVLPAWPAWPAWQTRARPLPILDPCLDPSSARSSSHGTL